MLAAFDDLGDETGFGDEDERLLSAFAASAATAVATGKSVEAQRLRESIEASEQERRRWARELHDETLQCLAGRTAARQGIAVDVHVDLARERGDAPARHIPELESTVYRLVQESLTNAVRHAAATRVQIEVAERDGFLEVAVSDDGTGFDPAARVSGFGLTGMRERVALAAGELDIQTAPTGTTIRARLPARRMAVE